MPCSIVCRRVFQDEYGRITGLFLHRRGSKRDRIGIEIRKQAACSGMACLAADSLVDQVHVPRARLDVRCCFHGRCMDWDFMS